MISLSKLQEGIGTTYKSEGAGFVGFGLLPIPDKFRVGLAAEVPKLKAILTSRGGEEVMNSECTEISRLQCKACVGPNYDLTRFPQLHEHLKRAGSLCSAA